MAVYKCISCGLLNFSGEAQCKKCGGELMGRTAEQSSQTTPAPAIYASAIQAPNDIISVGETSESTYADDYPWVTSEDEKVIESSNRTAKYATIAALIMAAIHLFLWFNASAMHYAVGENTGSDLSGLLGDMVKQSIMNAGVLCVIAFGMWRKSRIAGVVAPIILFLFSSHIWLGAIIQVIMRPTNSLFAVMLSANPIVALVVLVIHIAAFCCFIVGAVGAFKYQKRIGRLV